MEQESTRRRVLVVAAVALLVVALIAAVVVLALAGKSAADIAALLGVVVIVLGGIAPVLDNILKLRAETHQQTAVLAEIHENTNGKLDRRIREAVRQAPEISRMGELLSAMEADRSSNRRLLAATEAEECRRRSNVDSPLGTDSGNPYPARDTAVDGTEHPFED